MQLTKSRRRGILPRKMLTPNSRVSIEIISKAVCELSRTPLYIYLNDFYFVSGGKSTLI